MFEEGLDIRQPIVEKDTQLDIKEIYSSWLMVSEVIRREVLDNEALRAFLNNFVEKPVSQSIIPEFLTGITALSERVQKILHRYPNLTQYLIELPEVPETLIVPDLRHAKGLRDVQKDRTFFAEQGLIPPQIEERINLYNRWNSYFSGVTLQERQLVEIRYRIARDIKLFALMAELRDIHVGENPNTLSVKTPHGVQVVGETDPSVLQDLIHPERWQKRKQLKDRVYIIEVNGKKYILKERKTNRHTDTTHGGHKPGLTSREEYETAHHFSEKAGHSSKDWILKWEKPLGYVEFPDGFQFVIFQYEPVVSSQEAIQKLQEILLNNRKKIEPEYQHVKQMAAKFLQTDQAKRSLIETLLGRKAEPNLGQYTFEEFVRVKTYYLRHKSLEAERVFTAEIENNGYINTDDQGYMYVVNNDPPYLEILVMDFEYFKKVDKSNMIKVDPESTDYSLETMGEDGKSETINFPEWSDGAVVSEKDKAIYLALQEEDKPL